MKKTNLFLITDYRNITLEPVREPAYWVLRELDYNDKFSIDATVNIITDRSQFRNIRFHPLNIPGNITIQDPRYNLKIWKVYRKIAPRIDIIHHFDKFQVGIGYDAIPVLLKLYDKNLIIGPIEIPHKVFDEDFMFGITGYRKSIKGIALHNRAILRRFWKRLFLKTVDQTDIFIAPNKKTAEEMGRYTTSRKIEIIPYNYSITYGGAAIRRKGLDYLLNAMPDILSEYPETCIHLFAHGYLKDDLKKMAKELGIVSNVTFHSHVDNDTYLDCLSRSRLLCLPTLSEGYGWTVLEANCLGLPVVTTTECGADEFFEREPIGIQVEPANSEQLGEAIKRLFSDFSLCTKFSSNALKKREEYDYSAIVPKYLDIYKKYSG
jgi:glycosyltransferase involved in cell wall biosynthesis